MKKLVATLAVVLSFVLCLGGVSPAFAQQATQPYAREVFTFYIRPEQLAQGVQTYNQLKYDVIIPSTDISAMLPESLSDFPAAYKQVLEASQKKNGINGSFTDGWFDFQASRALVPGTNTLFTISAPIVPKQGRIYSVVAGIPSAQCPLKIKETSITFFNNSKDAESKAKELDDHGYLVYASPVDNLTIKAFSQLFYDQTTGKKKTSADCFLISGANEYVKFDFSQIYTLLPPALQEPARQASFVFFPRIGDSVFLVKAAKT